jgi:hypothetical protein
MSSAARPEVVRLGQLTDIVSAVPYLLGFHPAESLVAVALTGPRQRLSFALRLDLQPAEDDAEVARMCSVRMRRADATAVFLAIYTAAPRGDRTALPRRALVDTIEDALSMPLCDAALVADGRVWSYRCDDVECCPPSGRILDRATSGALAVAAANALHGNVALPDRDAVVASVAPLGGITEISMRQALRRAITRAATEPTAHRRVTRTLAAELVERYSRPPGRLSHDEAAQLVVGLRDVVLRDEMIGWSADHDDALLGLASDLVRHALPPLDAPACTLLAWVSYLRGDGLVAATALERALRSEPDYSLAQLLATALHGQVPPRELRRTMQDI